MKLFILFILFSTMLFAQTETHRWQALKTPLAKEEIQKTGTQNNFAHKLKSIYKVTISDYDGNHCRFSPSCSNYFVESIPLTNFLEANLMFADRFTRDLNFLNNLEYKRTDSGLLKDLPENRILGNRK